MKMLKKSLILSVTLALSLTVGKAQVFTTGTITGDADIETVGSVVYAFNFDPNSTSATVGSITFSGINPFSQSSTDFTLTGGGFDQTGGGNDPLNPGFDTNLSAGLQALNAFGVYGGPTVTFNGLTVGQQYSLQLIIDSNSHDDRTQAFNDSTNGSAPFPTSATVTAGGNQNPANATFAHGPYDPAYITDTFTATGTSETINGLIGGGTGAHVSGFVLETVTVPEPSTWAMMGLSFAGLALFLRKRASLRS